MSEEYTLMYEIEEVIATYIETLPYNIKEAFVVDFLDDLIKMDKYKDLVNDIMNLVDNPINNN
tara:strand:+ start:582 stop:770 length:189 start_codon:yes stop_codon:yes gene_type:complete